jgi:hypothetical protein
VTIVLPEWCRRWVIDSQKWSLFPDSKTGQLVMALDHTCNCLQILLLSLES